MSLVSCLPTAFGKALRVRTFVLKVTLMGFEPTTFELEVQCANHCATRPLGRENLIIFYSSEFSIPTKGLIRQSLSKYVHFSFVTVEHIPDTLSLKRSFAIFRNQMLGKWFALDIIKADSLWAIWHCQRHGNWFGWKGGSRPDIRELLGHSLLLDAPVSTITKYGQWHFRTWA